MSRSFTRSLIGVPVTDRAIGLKRAQSCCSDREIADSIVLALGVGAGEAEVAGTDPPGPPDLPAWSLLPRPSGTSATYRSPSWPLPAVALCRQLFTYGVRERIGSLGRHFFSRGE